MNLTSSLVAFAAMLTSVGATAAEPGPVQRDHVEVELVSSAAAVAPGSTVEVGLRLAHEPEWHTYWLNPGDSGLPTKLQWTLPQGFAASDILWPAPHRIDLDPLTNFGYEGEMVLPVQITVPASARPGDAADLSAKASWLICSEECIPGDAEVQLTLPIAATTTPNPKWQSLFAAAQAARPQPTGWQVDWQENGESIEVTIADGGAVKDLSHAEIFPFSATLIAHGRGEASRLDSDSIRFTTPKSDSYEPGDGPAQFLVATGEGQQRRVYHVSTGPITSAPADAVISAGVVQTGAQPTVLAAFALAFIGGLLLNLMPCVLPVLSLKALGLAEHAHDPAQSRRHGLLYLAGSLVCFVALASVLLGLRAAGEALGWGFQLQTPWVVASLAMLMTVMGLSLSGMFEFGTSWMGVGQELTQGSSARSAFFSGALAAVVASPCTAPFMGPALGFAVTQPTAIALGIFIALAVGLAMPILLLSFAPALGRWLPRPGAWMVRFKQFLAFPLYLTAVWLLWVLGRQLGADGMALTLVGMVALVLALWLWRSNRPGLVTRVAATLAFAGTVFTVVALGKVPQAGAATASPSDSIARAWSMDALKDLRASGKPVLVNMTAAWCITCLANERVALSSDDVKTRLQELDIAYLKGDWTHRDAQITEYLAQFGRNGVPLYVLYPRGDGEPEVLPQILTPALVRTALERAAGAQ